MSGSHSAKSVVLNRMAESQSMARIIAQAIYESGSDVDKDDVRRAIEGMDVLLGLAMDAAEGTEDKQLAPPVKASPEDTKPRARRRWKVRR